MGFARLTKVLVCAQLGLLAALPGQNLHADFIVTRGFASTTDTQFSRLRLNEVTRSGGTTTVGPSIELNPPLADAVSIFGFGDVSAFGQIVYGAFDPNDSSFDDLFVVDLNQPGRARQLNPVRTDLANTIVSAFLVVPTSPRVIYVVRNLNTNVDEVFFADSRLPGQATLIESLPAGTQITDIAALSADGSSVAFNVFTPGEPLAVAVSFLNRPPNLTMIHTRGDLTDYNANEEKFSDDGLRLAWTDSGANTEPATLQAVLLDPVAGSIGPIEQVNGTTVANERVIEFEFMPASNSVIAYRSFAPGTTVPSAVSVSDLASAVVTQLNPDPVNGATFTLLEDVLWRGNNVLYNLAELNPTRAELFSVAFDSPGDSVRLSQAVPFSSSQPAISATGVSHMVLSPDQDVTALIDGDPAVNVFTVDRFNIGGFAEPFGLSPTQSLGNLSDPMERPPQFNANSDLLAMVVRDDPLNADFSENLFVAAAGIDQSEVPVLSSPSPQVFQFSWLAPESVSTNAPTVTAAAVLPASRSGQVGSTLTAFITVINGGQSIAQACSIDLISNIPARLSYQTTDPTTNATMGTANTPVDIAPGGAQSFVVSISLEGSFAPRDTQLAYNCLNADAVSPLSGLNTLLLSSSVEPVADVVALAATVMADGIVRLDDAGNGAFSVASVNVGTSATIRVSGATSTGANVAICQSDPVTAACINPTAPTFDPVELAIDANATPTFSVFVASAQSIAADPAGNRVNVVFRDAADQVRGQTSVAVQTAP